LQAQVSVRFEALAAPTRHWGDAHPGVEVEASGALAHYFPEVLVVLEGSPDAVENGSSSPEREPGKHAMPDLDASQFFKVIFFRRTSNAVAAEARSLQAVNLRGHLLAGRQDVTTNNALETDDGLLQRKEKNFDVCKSACHSVECVSWQILVPTQHFLPGRGVEGNLQAEAAAAAAKLWARIWRDFFSTAFTSAPLSRDDDDGQMKKIFIRQTDTQTDRQTYVERERERY